MKSNACSNSIIALTLVVFLSGCVVAPPPRPVPYAGPVVAPGYVAPIVPPAGVTIVNPIGVAPGPGWGWAYHPQ